MTDFPFWKVVGETLAFLISLVVIFMVNAAALGAFGWPTQEPIWLLLTIPVALIIDAIWVTIVMERATRPSS